MYRWQKNLAMLDEKERQYNSQLANYKVLNFLLSVPLAVEFFFLHFVNHSQGSIIPFCVIDTSCFYGYIFCS